MATQLFKPLQSMLDGPAAVTYAGPMDKKLEYSDRSGAIDNIVLLSEAWITYVLISQQNLDHLCITPSILPDILSSTAKEGC